MVKDLLVEKNGPLFLVHADGEEFVAIEGGRGKPDLPVEDDGRGPTAVRDGCFPLDVFRFAPMQRQAEQVGLAWGVRAPVAPRAAEIGPIVPRGGGHATKQQEQDGGKCAHIGSYSTQRMQKMHPQRCEAVFAAGQSLTVSLQHPSMTGFHPASIILEPWKKPKPRQAP